jgi:hypothetical protein
VVFYHDNNGRDAAVFGPRIFKKNTQSTLFPDGYKAAETANLIKLDYLRFSLSCRFPVSSVGAS